MTTDPLDGLIDGGGEAQRRKVEQYRDELAGLHSTGLTEGQRRFAEVGAAFAAFGRATRGGKPAPADEQETQPMSLDEMLDEDAINRPAPNYWAAMEGAPRRITAYDDWLPDHLTWAEHAAQVLVAHADGDLADMHRGFAYATEQLGVAFDNAHTVVDRVVDRVAAYSVTGTPA